MLKRQIQKKMVRLSFQDKRIIVLGKTRIKGYLIRERKLILTKIEVV